MQPFPFKTMCDFKIGTLNLNGAAGTVLKELLSINYLKIRDFTFYSYRKHIAHLIMKEIGKKNGVGMFFLSLKSLSLQIVVEWVFCFPIILNQFHTMRRW